MNVRKIDDTTKKQLFGIFLTGQLLLIVGMVVMMVIVNTSSKPLDVPIDKWTSEYITFKDGSWFVEGGTIAVDDGLNLITSGKMAVGKGSYCVTVDYDADTQQTCYAISNSFISSSRARMVSNLHRATFNVNVNAAVSDFEVVVRYDGTGDLRINNITIKEDTAMLGRTLTYLIIIFAVCDLLYFFLDKVKKEKNVIMILLAAILFSSVPLFTQGLGIGHDLSFHLVRIEALAESLKCGVFPNRVSNFWLDGYSYPVSIYYGDLLLYIAAAMRLLGFTVTTSYKIYVLFVNISTVTVSYFCFKLMFKNKYTSAITTLVYCTAVYRLVNLYVRSAVGEYTAMLFLPVVACGMYKIYTGNMKSRRELMISAAMLSVGMTGLIGCHMLTTEMVFFVLVLVCLVLFKKTFTLDVIKALLSAVLITVLFSAYYIVPFIDYYFNVDVSITRIIRESYLLIQSSGCQPAEYFSVFRDVFSRFSVHNNARLAATPGLILMLTLVIGAGLSVYEGKKRSKQLLLYVFFSVVTLYLASDMFPWDWLSINTKIGGMLAQVQFPWRYVTLAIVFLTLAFAQLYGRVNVKDFGKHTHSVRAVTGFVIITVCFITSSIFTGNYIDDISFREWKDIGDVDTWAVSAGEYLLDDYNEDELLGEVTARNVESAEIVDRDASKMVVECKNAGDKAMIEFPIFNYKGYAVHDENGNDYTIWNGKNNTVKVSVPKGFSGKLTAEFVEPWYWRCAEAVSLVCFVGAFVLFLINLRSSRKKSFPKEKA